MYLYKIYGLIVESDIELVEGDVYRGGRGVQVRIRERDMGDVMRGIEGTIREERAEWSREGQEWSVCEIGRGQSILYYHTIGLFRISNGELIEYTAVMDVHSPMFRQWILNMALAIIKIQREEIVLHGSALLFPKSERAFMISGDSGSGKSTLADYLLQKECRFLTDDVAAVKFTEKEIYIDGAYPTRRLCHDVVEQQGLDKDKLLYIKDGGREKYILDMKDAYYGNRSYPLEAIFVLTLNQDKEDIQVIEHKGSEKLDWISSNLYRKRSYKQMGITPKIFAQCLRIAGEIPIYEIRRPVHAQTVERIAAIVLEMNNCHR